MSFEGKQQERLIRCDEDLVNLFNEVSVIHPCVIVDVEAKDNNKIRVSVKDRQDVKEQLIFGGLVLGINAMLNQIGAMRHRVRYLGSDDDLSISSEKLTTFELIAQG